MRQEIPLMLVVLLAGGVVGRVSSASREPTLPPAKQSSSPSTAAGPDDRCPGPRERITSFLLTRSERAPSESDRRPAGAIRGENIVAEIRVESPARSEAPRHASESPWKFEDKVETLIATVPDPLGSGLDYQFDLAVGAIQAAAGAVGYSLATSWLPWNVRGRAEETNDAAIECGRKNPGVLIFRTKGYVLLVFLVGETPTAGVHPGALESAIDLARKFQHPYEDGEEVLRVLGPSYSGSALSLSRVLDRHRNCDSKFRIVSGSASLEGIDQLLDRNRKQDSGPYDACLRRTSAGTATGAPRDEFRRTIHTHEALRQVAERHLTDLGIRCEQITYLVESSTFFGVVEGRIEPESASRYGGRSVRWCDTASPKRPHRIVFPLHVSDVRRALDRDRGPRGNLEIAGVELPKALLGLQEDRSSASRDLVPVFSHTSSNHEEMALATEISSACHARSRAFGIAATDSRDKRFLIERVRALCPGALVFTFQGDLLFAYPDDQSRLSGTLVFSSYPLFRPFDSLGASPAPRSAPTATTTFERASATPPLSDAASTGIYNAAIVHLDEVYGRYPENEKHADLKELVDYQCLPFGTSASRPPLRLPPVWMSIAGRNELLPIDAICDEQSQSMFLSPAGTDAPSPRPPRAPGGFRIVTMALAAYCAWISFLRWPTLGRSRSRWSAPHLAFAAFVLLVFILLTSARPPVLEWSWTRLGYVSLRYAVRAAAVLVVLATAAVVVAEARPGAAIVRPPASRRGALLYASVIGVVSCALGVGLDHLLAAAYTTASSDAARYFLFVRATALLSGVSPLLPLLLLAVALHLLMELQLRRSSLLEARFTNEHVFAGLLGRSSSTVAWADEQLRRLVRGHWPGPLLVAAGLAAVASIVVVLAWTPTPEGSWFDSLFRIGFAVIVVGVVVCCTRAALAWRALRTLLRRMARHPLQHAIRKLPRVTSQERFTNLLSMRPTVRELEFSEALLAHCGVAESAEQTRARARLIHDHINGLGAGPLADRGGPWSTRPFEEHQLIAEQLATPALQARWRLEASDEQRTPSAEELFIARQFELGVAWMVAHIRELLSVSVFGALLLAMACSVYPFPATHRLMLAVWILLIAAVLTAIWVVYSFERTEVAAWMARARPGRIVDWKLAVRVVMLCVVPVVAVIAIQFPDSAAWLARLFDPFVAMAK